MLVYLRFLLATGEQSPPEIQVLSQIQGCLAFTSTSPLEPGVCRVTAPSGGGKVSFEIDIYHHDSRHNFYEGRVVPGSQRKCEDENAKPKTDGLFAEVKEEFVSGTRVRTEQAVPIGTFIKVECDEGDNLDSSNDYFAEVLYVEAAEHGRYDLRLKYREQNEIERLLVGNKLSALGQLAFPK